MGFKWLCPCGKVNQYDGKKTTDAITTCPSCNTKSRVFKYKIVVKPQKKPPKPQITTPINYVEISGGIKEDLTLGIDFDRTVLIAGLMDTIRIYKNKFLGRDGKILGTIHKEEGKKVLEWVERHETQREVPLLVVHQSYFQKVLKAYLELEKLRV